LAFGGNAHLKFKTHTGNAHVFMLRLLLKEGEGPVLSWDEVGADEVNLLIPASVGGSD